jgi:hypothetical protein
MKNIHLIPTDKPSRLHLGDSGLVLCDLNFGRNTINGQNIYITNDEFIKEGDFGLNLSTKNIVQYDGIKGLDSYYKKIILTTDQDLIKDGVQAIDDEFLQWFIQNQSCEKVEVIKNYLSNNGQWKDVLLPSEWEIDTKIKYKIIIPQEEPRLINNCPKCGLDLVEREGCKPVCTRIDCGGIILSNETLKEWALKEEPKQTDENGKPITYWGGLEEPKQDYSGVHLRHCYQGEYEDGCKYGEDDCPAKPLEPKQETLEEAAERMYPINSTDGVMEMLNKHQLNNSYKQEGFIAGAKSDAAKDYWFEKFQQGKWVQVEKIKAQIEMLEGVDGEYYYAIPISRKIESLQKQLKQLEDEN